MVLLKHVVLIMLKAWMTLDRKGRTRDQIWSLMKDLKNVTKKEILRTCEEIYGLSGLEKINSIVILEIKLLAEDPCQGWKIEYFPKVQDHLIQKRGTYPLDVCYRARGFLVN